MTGRLWFRGRLIRGTPDPPMTRAEVDAKMDAARDNVNARLAQIAADAEAAVMVEEPPAEEEQNGDPKAR